MLIKISSFHQLHEYKKDIEENNHNAIFIFICSNELSNMVIEKFEELSKDLIIKVFIIDMRESIDIAVEMGVSKFPYGVYPEIACYVYGLYLKPRKIKDIDELNVDLGLVKHIDSIDARREML